MDEQKKRKIDNMIFALSMLLVACVVAFFVYTAVVRKEMGMEYYVVICVFLGAFWLLTDVVSVVLTRGMEGKTEEQVKAYRIYALLDLAGLAGLGYFACAVGTNSGIMGALVYVLTLSYKRKYRDVYRGIRKEAEPVADAEAEELEEVEEATEQEALEGPEEATEPDILEDAGADPENEVMNGTAADEEIEGNEKPAAEKVPLAELMKQK